MTLAKKNWQETLVIWSLVPNVQKLSKIRSMTNVPTVESIVFWLLKLKIIMVSGRHWVMTHDNTPTICLPLPSLVGGWRLWATVHENLFLSSKVKLSPAHPSSVLRKQIHPTISRLSALSSHLSAWKPGLHMIVGETVEGKALKWFFKSRNLRHGRVFLQSLKAC